MFNNKDPYGINTPDKDPYGIDKPQTEQKEPYASNNQGSWKSVFDRLKAKKKKKKEEKEDDALDKLSTLNQKSEEVRKKTIKRFVILTLVMSIGMFILIGLVKFGMVMYKGGGRQPIKTKVEKVKLEINTFSKWQEAKDEELNGVHKDIKHIDNKLTKSIKNVKKELKEDINTTTNTIITKISQTQEENNQFVTSTLQNLKKAISNSETISKKYADTKSKTIEEKINDVIIKNRTRRRKAQLDFSKLALLPLPKNNKQTSTNSQLYNSNNIAVTNKPKPKIKTELVERAIAPATTISVSTMDISTLNKNKNKLPTFTIMPGFTKGTIITGAAVPTLSQGKSSPRPVWISFSGDTIIANNDTANVNECILQAAATGDFASGVAEIRLSQISCSATDKNGQKYKIIHKVKGWVYSENGQYGLKGRLITKEGKIIAKAIPLTILESTMAAISKGIGGIGNTNTNRYGYGNTNAGAAAGAAALGGVGKGSNRVLSKLSDYYLKMLEALNPVIEIKAGREIVIAFAGGEKLKLEKYTPADINYFEDKGLK